MFHWNSCRSVLVCMRMWMSRWCFLLSSVWELTAVQRGKIIILQHRWSGMSLCVSSYFKPRFSLTHSKWQISFERERASSFTNLWCVRTDGTHSGNSCSSECPDSFAALTSSQNLLSFFPKEIWCACVFCECVCMCRRRSKVSDHRS